LRTRKEAQERRADLRFPFPSVSLSSRPKRDTQTSSLGLISPSFTPSPSSTTSSSRSTRINGTAERKPQSNPYAFTSPPPPRLAALPSTPSKPLSPKDLPIPISTPSSTLSSSISSGFLEESLRTFTSNFRTGRVSRDFSSSKRSSKTTFLGPGPAFWLCLSTGIFESAMISRVQTFARSSTGL